MSTNFWNADPTAGNNTTIGGVASQGTSAVSNFDNIVRALHAMMRTFANDIGGIGTVGGTADAITIATSQTITAYVDGLIVAFVATADNTATSVTANIDSLGTKPIKKAVAGTETAPAVGDIKSGNLYLLRYRSAWNSSSGAFQLIDVNHTVSLLDEDNFASDSATAGATQQSIKAYITATSLALAGGTMTGELILADQLLTRPKIKDYGEVVNAIGSIGGGTQDIDLESGNVVTATVDTSTTTFTFSNPPASGVAGSFTLFLTNGGSQTVNWPASVDWAAATAPTLTASGVDILSFVTVDGGTTWYGFTAGLDMG